MNTPFRSPAARSVAAVAAALAVVLSSGTTLTASAVDQSTGSGAWSVTDPSGRHGRFVDKHGLDRGELVPVARLHRRARLERGVSDGVVWRVRHAATLLPDGRVLITGGSPDNQWHPVRSAEIFDPRTNKFTAISDMELARFKIPDATAVLKNGRILIAGGAAEVEVYDNAAGKFFRAGSLDEAHFFASTTLLQDGRALITGGYTASRGRPNGPLSTEQAWIYVP